MKQNRVRLRGLSESGAAEAIWIPGHDCIKQQDFQKVSSDIIAAAPNGDGTVNTLLLSIICTNLFEQLGDGQLIDSEMTRDLNYPIESFYREQISKLPRRERLFVEQEMTNGPQRKPVSLSEFKKHAPQALKLATPLFHLFPLPGTDKMHVELMHDRLAEVVYNIKKQEGESKGVKTIRGYITFFIVLIACYALYQGQTTDDKYKVTSAFTEIRDHRYSTTDTLWIGPEVLRDNGAVEELAIEDKKEYNIINCPYLTTIDLSNIRTDSFYLELEDLPMLRTITMPKVMPYLKLKANKCPRLLLTIHSGMGKLELDCEKMSVHVEQDVKRYVWNDRILWDLEERNIVFFDSETHPNNTIRCFFPTSILERSLHFKEKTFQNLQPEQNVDNRSWTSHHLSRNATIINKEHLTQDAKEIFFPDSVYSIPDKACYQFHRLEQVKMPRKTIVIYESAFEGCDRLRSITLPDNLEDIEKHAFKGCKQLKSIIIPASVKNIGEEAFAGCDSLRSITILGNPNLGARAFAFNQVLNHVEWNDNETKEFIYFFNPFFDCPKVDLQSLKINIMERPECRTTAEGITFSRDGFIYAREYPAELHFPLYAGAYDWTFIGDTSPLTDIYVPFAHPEPISAITNTKRAFYIHLPDAQKSYINLHVPYENLSHYLKSNDLERSWMISGNIKWQGRHIIVYEKGQKWYALDIRNFTEQEISKQAPDLSRLYGYSIRTFNNRYLIIGNTAYERSYAFDTEDNCSLIGQLDGQWFEDYDFCSRLNFQFTRHRWLEKGDSIQFYCFIDNHLKRGSCLPIEVAKEKTWTDGFIIATKDGISKIYSMDDNLSQPIVLHNELTTGTFLSGRTLLIPVSNDLHVYEYDGLKELIERTSLSRSYKDQLLQRIH